MDSIKAKVSKAKDGITIDLVGDQYSLDTKYAMLIDKSDPLNSISFGDMHNMGSHYILHYDPELKNHNAPWEPQTRTLILPQLVELDPDGISAKYGIPVANLPKRDDSLRMDEKFLMDRLVGKLPQLAIGHKLYNVDFNAMQLLNKADSGDIVDLRSLTTTFDGRFIGYYNEVSENVTNLQGMDSNNPDKTKMVLLPSMEWLDPVHTARIFNLPETALQKDYPAMALHQSQTFPLSEHARLRIAEIKDGIRKTKIDLPLNKPKRKKGRKL